MACNWLMMTSSGDDNRPSGSLGLLTDKTKKNNNNNKPKAEQETAQPTAARFKKNKNKPKAEQETAQPTAARFKKDLPKRHARIDLDRKQSLCDICFEIQCAVVETINKKLFW